MIIFFANFFLIRTLVNSFPKDPVPPEIKYVFNRFIVCIFFKIIFRFLFFLSKNPINFLFLTKLIFLLFKQMSNSILYKDLLLKLNGKIISAKLSPDKPILIS